MKRLIRIIGILFIIAIIILLFCGIEKLTIEFTGRKTVEEYCSVAYQNSVDEYKTCKELNMVQLINKLKEETAKRHEVPDLSALKF